MDERYPLRDADGRIVRIREEWDAWAVICRVYSLWVRDVLEEQDAFEGIV